jgi:hypothetical protein
VGSPARCGNAAFNNDILLGYGAGLCRAFGADCMHTAWGGITLQGMVPLYPFTFSSTGPGAGYSPYSFPRAADAVVVNLGTNGGDNAPGLIEVRDARLPSPVAQATGKDPALRDALFAVVHATAIQPDTGTAADRSLRSFRVAVPMRLRGQIAWRPDVPADDPLAREWDGIVERALPLVLGVGAHRHRGLGEAVLSLAP